MVLRDAAPAAVEAPLYAPLLAAGAAIDRRGGKRRERVLGSVRIVVDRIGPLPAGAQPEE